MFIIIDVCSKNYCALNQFLRMFLNKKVCNKLNLIILKSSLQKKKKKKIFTTLKSPHVNKTAQEHFEYRVYRKQLKCLTFQTFLFLIFLKKVKFYLFSDVNVKISVIRNYNNSKKKIKNKFDIDNYCLDLNKSNLADYLTFLEVYGELSLKSKL